MSTIRRSRTVIATVAAVLAVVLVAPLAVQAEDQVIAEEQILVVEEQVPALSTNQDPTGGRWAPARPMVPASLVDATIEGMWGHTARLEAQANAYRASVEASDATIEGMWGQAARLEAQAALLFGERTE